MFHCRVNLGMGICHIRITYLSTQLGASGTLSANKFYIFNLFCLP